MYPPNLNVPLPEPETIAPQQPDKMQQALSMIVPLFSLGTALGGSPHAGASFLHGAHQTLQRQQQESEQRAYQQQQLAVRQQAMQAQERARMMAEQQAIETAKRNLILKTVEEVKGLPRDQYEQIMSRNENIGTALLGMRPNMIRSAVPWMAPNANEMMAAAGNAWLKNQANKDAIDRGEFKGSILVDVQGDGKPIPVPLVDALKAAGQSFDPGTGQLLMMPKEAKATGSVQLDDEAFLGEVAKFEAEKGRKATPQERGEIAVRVKRMMEKPASPQPQGTLPPRTQSRVDNISKAFSAEPIVKRANTQAEAVSFINSLDPNSKNPADDQALIYAFAKAMDPDSVVREGEYATVQKYAQSWLQSFGFNAARVLSNTEFLTPQARANMRSTILKKYAAGRMQYDNVRKSYARKIMASSGGLVDPEDYLTDYAAVFPDPQTGAQPKPQQFSVVAPDGQTYTFPSQAQADAFKAALSGKKK